MNKSLLALIKAYKEYIALLSDEIENNASFLYMHDIQTSKDAVSKGIKLRKQIEKLEKENKIE